MLIWLALASLGLASETEIQESFVKFLVDHRPEGYASPTETLKRYEIFKTNYETILAHNTAQSSYTLGVNKFADLTQEEFVAAYINPVTLDRQLPVEGLTDWVGADPEAWDWAAQGGITEVEVEHGIDDSVVISVVKSVENLHYVTSGKLVQLSAQQLIDCKHGFNSAYDYMTYIIFAGGLMSEADYPTTGNKEECKFNRNKITAQVNHFSEEGKFNQTALEDSVYQGAVAVGIDATSPVFQFYKSGIIDSNCGKEIDHYVLLVGYGDGFWRVQNTWGSDWGEHGYARLLKDGNSLQWGECGIAISPIRPVLVS